MPRYTVRGEEKYYFSPEHLITTIIVIDNYTNQLVPHDELGISVIDHQPTIIHEPVDDMKEDRPICTFGYEFAEDQAKFIVGQSRGRRTLVLIREMHPNANLITGNDAREMAGYTRRREEPSNK